MNTTNLIIGLVSAGAAFMSFLFGRRTPTKLLKCFSYALAGLLFFTTVASVVLNYWTGSETEEQLQLARDQASEAIVYADRVQEQIIEIRTPRRMEPETKRMLSASLKPYAGQKYDMKVFRDQDSLELATAIQAILEEAGGVYTNVYPKHETRRYAETGDDGVFIISAKVETRSASEARIALHGALNEAGLYDDSTAFSPVSCIETTGSIEVGSKVTRIPCSESSVQSIKIYFTVHDDIIREDTLVLHVGKERL